MRGAENNFFASMFAFGLVALVGLGPKDGQGDQAKAQVIATEAIPCNDTFCATKSPDGTTWHLRYGFKGLHDQWHQVTCDIRVADSEQLNSSYGFLDKEQTALWSKDFEKAVNAAARNILDYGEARIINGRIELLQIRELPPLRGEEIMASERNKFSCWYKEHAEGLGRLANEKFLKDHGFIIVPNLDRIPDYSTLVWKSARAMRSCVDAFNRETGGQPELLQAFFQSMNFEKIELVDKKTGKRTGGLSLPPTVMIEGKGDCDSKAAAYCTIQRENNPRLVILRSFPSNHAPNHALVGVEAYKKDGSHPQEAWSYRTLPEALRAILYDKPIRIGLRDYWPCEVVGPHRTDFGAVAAGHEGRYIAIRIR